MRAVTILLALIAVAATWFVFGPRRIDPQRNRLRPL